MVNAIAAINRLDSTLLQNGGLDASRPLSAEDLEVKETFKQSVGGTFFKQMLKALRSTQGKPAYFHGGQAEEFFQARMDDQIAEDMAHRQGDAFTEPLFTAYMRSNASVRQSSGS